VNIMWNLLTDRRVLLSAAAIGGLAAVALWPSTELVDVAAVTRGPLIITVDEEGRTRVRDRFVVTAPAGGRVERIELEPGDRVAAGDVVARLRAEPPALLDARTQAEAIAAATSAAAVLGRARADEQRARAALAQAERELTRSQTLTTAGATTRQELEARQAEALLARETVEAAVFAAQAAAADAERARARVATPPSRAAAGVIIVRAPAAGVVLRRLRESEAVVPPGEPLLEIGDPRQIEIVTDLLSTDAVRVVPGARALIEDWGGDATLAATVKRIEPSGFTKVSALGVEEQRVNVVLDLADPSACALLGDAYRVEARIVLWEHADVIRVPTNALFRQGADWAVYTVSDGRARLVTVTIGHQNGQHTEVTAGLSPGAIVVVHPGDLVRDGGRVRERPHP
jgi:HlyD family secretion protein